MNKVWFAIGLLALAAPRSALAYAVPIHQLMPRRALAADRALTAETLPAVTAADLAAFRAWLDARFREHADPKVRERYAKRWPAPAKFGARAEKLLFGWNEDREIDAVDRAGGLPCTPLDALSTGSGQPDLDWRNRERLAHDARGRPMKLPDGRDVPADPLILNMGNARGLSSQAHAHYGLAAVAFSQDASVLRDEPWRFALAAGWPRGPVRTLARESCQLHYDLAVLAMLWGQPAGRSLAYLFLGQGMHYLEDVGNQVHTVQVGWYGLLLRARLVALERAVRTLGGYLDDLKPWTRVGIDLLTTHHVLSESLNAKRIAEALAGKPVPPVIQRTLAGLAEDDPELAADLQPALAAPGTARAAAITGCLIARSCHEGGEVYRHVAGALAPRMSKYGVLVDDEDVDPDTTLGDLTDPEVAAHLEALYGLQERAYRRVGTALRRLVASFDQDRTAPNDAERAARVRTFADRLLAERLDELDGQEARLAEYLADPPAASAPTVHQPGYLLLPLLPIAILALLVRRLRRR